ncbi:MAG: hypothetical protein V9G19_05240 [Tetrasphaera sp.]
MTETAEEPTIAPLEWNADYVELPITTTELNQLVRHVTWELSRYGGVDEAAIMGLLPMEPTPPLAVALRNLTPGPHPDDPKVDASEHAFRSATAQFHEGRRRYRRLYP